LGTSSTTGQGRNYLNLLTKLRIVLPLPRYLLTMATTTGNWSLKHVDLAKVSQQVDLLNLMHTALSCLASNIAQSAVTTPNCKLPKRLPTKIQSSLVQMLYSTSSLEASWPVSFFSGFCRTAVPLLELWVFINHTLRQVAILALVYI
jgi:hypothetical protein